MLFNAISSAQIAVFLGLNLVLALVIAKKRGRRQQPLLADSHWSSMLPISAFSNVDHAALQRHEEVNPLTEAEIYVIYGRRKDAGEVLNAGLREGRITAADIALFWEKDQTQRRKVRDAA